MGAFSLIVVINLLNRIDMGLLEDCEKCFNTSSLYEVLGVDETAKPAELKKSFYKKSLQYHPDRQQGGKEENITLKFQTLNKVYKFLSDEEKRKVYDDGGDVEDTDAALFAKDDMDFMSYWRNIFPKVTQKDINDFEAKFKHSEEEKEELKKYYLKYQGNMDRIFECLMFAEIADEDRYHEIINEMIEAGKVPAYEAFTNEPKKKKLARKRKYEREAKEAAKVASGGGLEDLTAAILRRHQDREQNHNNFLANLEAKYASKGKKPKK